MNSRARQTLVSFQRAVTAENDLGEAVSTWQQLGQAKARIYWGRGDERRQAAQEQGVQAATFEVLANSMTRALAITDRIIADGRVWDITGIAPIERGSLELTATAAGDAP